MPYALKVSPGEFIVLDHVKGWSIDNDDKIISLVVDYSVPNIEITAKSSGEGEYHRIIRELEDFFSANL